MLAFLFRLFWRILVGLLALGLAFFSRYLIFPYLDDHMPILVALAILYLLAAYIGIPFLVRLWRLVLKPNHLPIYASSRDGWSSDPVNVAIVCKNPEQLIQAMERAGWQQADRTTLWSALRLGYAMLLNKPYPTAPFSSLFLFGRRQDIGFQIQTGTPPTPRHRHHIRFWQLDTTPQATHIHHNFWQTVLALFARKKRQIWIGAATHDIKPFVFRAQNLQVTHGIDPETNRERDYVIKTLEDKGLVRRVETITTGEPLQFRGQAVGVRIVVDGKLKVVELKNPRQ
jgi:LssY C-terminus